ncbi:MAG: sterol desaturase family protein [Acidimicrobiales bacterium]
MHELSAVRSLRQAAKVFAGRPSPKLFVGAAAATLSGRALLGRWGRRDALAATAVLASRPFAEWLIHRNVLHAPPVVVGDRTIDMGAAHRRHHREPADVDFVLVDCRYARYYVVGWAATAAAIAAALPGRRRGRLRPTLMGLGVAYASLVTYEWTHLVIHTAYRPQHRWLRRRRAQHRRHHFRNEHYWYGVTTDVADRVLRTGPPARSVELSGTARTLGVEP